MLYSPAQRRKPEKHSRATPMQRPVRGLNALAVINVTEQRGRRGVAGAAAGWPGRPAGCAAWMAR